MIDASNKGDRRGTEYYRAGVKDLETAVNNIRNTARRYATRLGISDERFEEILDYTSKLG